MLYTALTSLDKSWTARWDCGGGVGAGGSSSRPPAAPVSTLITKEREREREKEEKRKHVVNWDHAH